MKRKPLVWVESVQPQDKHGIWEQWDLGKDLRDSVGI
jgi:hypothetical protein